MNTNKLMREAFMLARRIAADKERLAKIKSVIRNTSPEATVYEVREHVVKEHYRAGGRRVRLKY